MTLSGYQTLQKLLEPPTSAQVGVTAPAFSSLLGYLKRLGLSDLMMSTKAMKLKKEFASHQQEDWTCAPETVRCVWLWHWSLHRVEIQLALPLFVS